MVRPLIIECLNPNVQNDDGRCYTDLTFEFLPMINLVFLFIMLHIDLKSRAGSKCTSACLPRNRILLSLILL